MNLSDTSSIVQLLFGAIAVCAWLWKLFAWFCKRHIEAKELADEGARLAQVLLSHATSPAKRSDIHLFMMLRAMQSASRQTQGTIHSMGMGILIAVLFLFVVSVSNFLVIDYTHPLVIFTLLTFVCLIASFCMSLWFSFNLRRLEEGWQVGTMNAIEQKIERHVPEA